MSTEDLQDADQVYYKVHSNPEPFNIYRNRYQKDVQEREDDYFKLSNDMCNYFESNKQPIEEFNRKMDLCSQLKSTVLKYCPKWIFDVVPTGSSVSGLATADSDLDVAIHIPQASFIALDEPVTVRRIQLNILQIIRRIIMNDEDFKKRINFEKGVQLVQAQIQILKIETTDKIECDISVVLSTFLSSMHNSHLIRHFYHIDGRFGPLCAVVKQWAASTGVKNPKNGGFNSYAMVLLVIHFLQCGTLPPILPNLQEIYRDQKFIAKNQLDFPMRLDFGARLPFALPEIDMNRASVAELFLQFVHYYANFDFRNRYISIPFARVQRRSESHADVQNQRNKEVYIEDPFDEHNPGRTCRSLNEIRIVFRETVNKFDPTLSPDFKFPTIQDILQMSSSIRIDGTAPEDEEDDVEKDEDDVL